MKHLLIIMVEWRKTWQDYLLLTSCWLVVLVTMFPTFFLFLYILYYFQPKKSEICESLQLGIEPNRYNTVKMFPTLLLSRFISRWITCTGNKRKEVVTGSVNSVMLRPVKGSGRVNVIVAMISFGMRDHTSVSQPTGTLHRKSLFVIGAADCGPETLMGRNLNKPICSIHNDIYSLLHILRNIYRDPANDVGYTEEDSKS